MIVRYTLSKQEAVDATVIEEVPLLLEKGFKMKTCRFQILNPGDFTGITGVAFIRIGLARSFTDYNSAEDGDSNSPTGLVSQDIYLSASSFNLVREIRIPDEPMVINGGLWLSLNSVGAITDRLIVGVMIEGDYLNLSELQKAQLEFNGRFF